MRIFARKIPIYAVCSGMSLAGCDVIQDLQDDFGIASGSISHFPALDHPELMSQERTLITAFVGQKSGESFEGVTNAEVTVVLPGGETRDLLAADPDEFAEGMYILDTDDTDTVPTAYVAGEYTFYIKQGTSESTGSMMMDDAAEGDDAPVDGADPMEGGDMSGLVQRADADFGGSVIAPQQLLDTDLADSAGAVLLRTQTVLGQELRHYPHPVNTPLVLTWPREKGTIGYVTVIQANPDNPDEPTATFPATGETVEELIARCFPSLESAVTEVKAALNDASIEDLADIRKKLGIPPLDVSGVIDLINSGPAELDPGRFVPACAFPEPGVYGLFVVANNLGEAIDVAGDGLTILEEKMPFVAGSAAGILITISE